MMNIPIIIYTHSSFPILHVTTYDKWIYTENIPYIDDLIKDYNIDITIRGAL